MSKKLLRSYPKIDGSFAKARPIALSFKWLFILFLLLPQLLIAQTITEKVKLPKTPVFTIDSFSHPQQLKSFYQITFNHSNKIEERNAKDQF